MNYKDALDYLHRLRVFGSQPGLVRIASLCEELGNPQDDLKFIHVTGTNGKGSVCQMFYRTLCNAGYNTGLFVSPYVINFSERMQANGQCITEDEVSDLMEQVKQANERLAKRGIVPTEFETLTALSFLFYKMKNCEIVVLEAGMGGRNDSTNIINTTILSVIVSIGLDHTDFLGNSLEEIAYEKAGIIKSSPAIIPNLEKNLISIFQKESIRNNTQLFVANKDLFSVIKTDIYGSTIKYKDKIFNYSLVGDKQLENLNLFLCGIEVLKKEYDIELKAVINALENLKIPGRFDIFMKNPLVILDGAHNEAAAKNLANTIKKLLKNQKICLITGVMADKDYEKFAALISPLVDKIYTVNIDNKRSLSSETFAKIISKYNKNTTALDNYKDAIKTAMNFDFDIFLVTGSFYLVSEAYNTKL
ncbi:MAG: folylpolyglutamate synthase/dihydrofolate synthase family protein [Clostridia bacterium]|nr:folylpolyglutamate synthase/dihydrofolate synthase family protein [Clostridia bacterium]